MKKAILASFYHKCSTDEKPQHQYCPISTTEKESWCPYRRAEAKGILKDYKHPLAFDEETQEVLKSIYEDLTSDELLERCLGANTQKNNESYNSCVWNIVPKHKFVAKKILEIAAYSAACIFNEGLFPIFKSYASHESQDWTASKTVRGEGQLLAH